MDVELIGDEDPAVRRGRRDRLCDVCHKVFFRARGPNARRDLLAGGDLEVGDQAWRAVANIFVFLALAPAFLPGPARLHGFGRCGAFEGLDAGLFIRTNHVRARGVQLRGLLIQRADRFDLRLKFFCVRLRSVEPVLNPMRF